MTSSEKIELYNSYNITKNRIPTNNIYFFSLYLNCINGLCHLV